MTTDNTIFSIESAPGDAPRGVEQPNGDLLVPANVRPLIAQALRQAEFALADYHGELPALQDAKRLLGIEPEQAEPSWLVNLYCVRRL